MGKPKLVAHIAPAVPLELGRLLSAEDVAREHFGGRVSARWVRARFPLANAVMIRRSPHWYEADVRAALAELRGAA